YIANRDNCDPLGDFALRRPKRSTAALDPSSGKRLATRDYDSLLVTHGHGPLPAAHVEANVLHPQFTWSTTLLGCCSWRAPWPRPSEASRRTALLGGKR